MYFLNGPDTRKRWQIESRWKDNLGRFVTSLCPGVSVGVFKVFQQ